MKKLFEVAGGSITGTHHRLSGKNNQDAFYSVSSEKVTLAVVCDGCGSGSHSEVGAKIGAQLVGEAIQRSLGDDLHDPPFTDDFWEQVREEVLIRLQNLALAMDGDGYNLSPEIIHHYFLFTIVGVVVTPMGAAVFSIGDGVIIVNNEPILLGPFPHNAPPYLAYGLLTASEQWRFQVHTQINPDSIQSILIGTDGVSDLINAAEKKLPGKQQTVGSIRQFWEEDRYFKNPDMVRRQLALINREVTKTDWQNRQIQKEVGCLPDDTTLIVIRRRQGMSHES